MTRLLALMICTAGLAGCMGASSATPPTMGPAGTTSGAASTPGPTAASLPPPGTPMTPEVCMQYRKAAEGAGMMTPSLDAQLKQSGC